MTTISDLILEHFKHSDIQIALPSYLTPEQRHHWDSGCAAAQLPLPPAQSHIHKMQKHGFKEMGGRFSIGKTEIEKRARLHKNLNRSKDNLAVGYCGICYVDWSADRTKRIATLNCCGQVGHAECLRACRANNDSCPFCRKAPMKLIE